MPFLAALFMFAADAPATVLADARAVAQTGMLATVARLKTMAEIDELIADHPELSDGDKSALRNAGEVSANTAIERAIAAEAAAYAANLSPSDLAALAAFTRTDAAKAQRAAMPAVMMATMQALKAGGEIHFKEDTLAAFCAATGKLCEAK
jgi:hypothetical protein